MSRGIDAGAGRGSGVAASMAEIAGGLVRQGVPAFEDAGALDDPVGIEAEALVQVVVGDDGVGHVAARADDAEAGQTAAAWPRRDPVGRIEASMGHG